MVQKGCKLTIDTSQKRRASKIYKELIKRYPDAHCALTYKNPFELLVATILSAQSTDVGVNKATPALFKEFPNPESFAKVTPKTIEPFIATIGLFRSKAKSIHASSTLIVKEFGGEVPNTMKDLLKLRGVARKTANVVLGNAFNKNEGIVVDTHVARISQRFGLTNEENPVKIENQLMTLFPKEQWSMLSHLFIRHGREICKKRGGRCESDSICKRYCSNAEKT